MKHPKKALLFLIVLLIIIAGILGESLRSAWLKEIREKNEFSRDQIESRTAIRTPPFLVIEGTSSDLKIDREYQRTTTILGERKFELVMQGLTNYFRKETWGAKRGQSSFFGGQKPGGGEVVIRAKDFSGDWHFGWSGTHGGGGGGGFEEYQDDFLPGRWLWNHNGFVGAEGDYENHSVIIQHGYYDKRKTYEEYQNCKSVNGYLIPQKIIWREFVGLDQNGEYELREEKTFKIKSFKFQDTLSNGWFAAQVEEYFPSSTRRTITNAPADSASTNQGTIIEMRSGRIN